MQGLSDSKGSFPVGSKFFVHPVSTCFSSLSPYLIVFVESPWFDFGVILFG